MIKKIFVAVLAALFIMSSRTFAEIPIDWNRVQRISSKSDLAKYIEASRQRNEDFLPVILTNGLTINVHEFITLCPSSVVSQKVIANDGQNMRIIFQIKDYPGTRVANAYLSGNTDWLSADEKQLYNAAVAVVNEAKKRDSDLGKELYIYEHIMNHATYLTGDMNNQPRFVTAMGVLLDGKANCQGYADAFYMLGRMCGLNVGRISGQAGGGGHLWNTITFKDGKTYFVDTTWDDSNIKFGGFRNYNSYIYFNAPVEIMQATHAWDWSLAPANLQSSIDERYGYCCLTNTKRLNNAAAGLKLLAKKIATENQKWFSVMVPYDENFSNKHIQEVSDYLGNELSKYNAKVRFYLYVNKYGNYLVFMVAVP